MLSGRPFFVAAALALAVDVTVAAQNKPTATLRCEAATIRPSAPDGSPISGTMLEGNRLRGTRTTLLALIRSVYFEEGLISPQQFVDGPQWIRTERWDVNAVAVDSPTRAEFNEMLRTLITDRFKLRVRRERRELPVVALLARDDRRLGARLTSVRVDCAAYQEAFAQLQSRPAREPGAPLQPTTCDTLTVVGGTLTRVSGRAIQMSDLVRTLTPYLGQGSPVLDRTGLTGQYDYDLEFVQNPLAESPSAGASIETALREQLGLRTERQRAPMDVLVIESAERPTPE